MRIIVIVLIALFFTNNDSITNIHSLISSDITFEELKSNYLTPAAISRENLFKNVLKGDWSKLFDNENYINTCAIRMSIALNSSGMKVSKEHSDGNHRDGSGNFIAIKVPTIKTFLKKNLGDSFWGMSKVPNQEFDFESHIPPGKGIILYTFNNGPANGHVDLWNGNNCMNSCPTVDTNDAATVEFWKLD